MKNIPYFKDIDTLYAALGIVVINDELEYSLHRIKGRIGRKKITSHRKEFYSIAFIENGKGMMTINHHSFKYVENTIAVTAPGQIIAFERESEINGFTIFFTLPFIKLSKQALEEQFSFTKLNSNTIFQLTKDADKIKKSFEEIEIEFLKKDRYHKEVIKNLLLVLLNLIKRNYLSEAQPPLNRNQELTQQFEALVQNHMPKRKPVQFYASQLTITNKHLIEVIKKTTGKTPTEFIQNIHMQEAKKLLIHSSFTVSEITYQLGFNDSSYLNKVFKKQFGKTPLDFRKEQVK